MNRSILGRVFSILLLFCILAFALFFAYCLATFSGSQALPAFQWAYSAEQAFLLLVEYLVPIEVAGIVVAFSFGSPHAGTKGRESGEPFNKIVSSTLIAFIFLTVIYTVLFEGVAPYVRGKIADTEYQSRLAREFLSQATADRQKGDYQSALAYTGLYLKIDKANSALLAMEQDLESRAAKQKVEKTVGPAPMEPAQDLDAATLIDKARSSFEKQDYFQAHYYATQALTLEPGRSDAIRLAALAWDKITAFTPALADAEAARLYERKREAYTALMRGDAMGAYYSFMTLAAQYPKDKDVEEYLQKSRDAVQRTTFFIDETQSVLALPGTRNVLFINSEQKGSIEAVAISKLIQTIEGTYAVGVESVSYRPDGGILYHFTAPYGKMDGNTLLLHAIDREDPKIQYLPLYSQGTRPKEERDFLAIRPTVEEMRALGTEGGGPALGLADLWRMKDSLAGFGVMAQGISVRIVMDALMPFVFLTLSFLAVSFGWAFRARYLGRPPLFLFLFVPLVPFVASLLSLLWVYAHRVILGFTVIAFGLTAGLVACAVLELLTLVVSLVLLAGQTAE